VYVWKIHVKKSPSRLRPMCACACVCVCVCLRERVCVCVCLYMPTYVSTEARVCLHRRSNNRALDLMEEYKGSRETWWKNMRALTKLDGRIWGHSRRHLPRMKRPTWTIWWHLQNRQGGKKKCTYEECRFAMSGCPLKKSLFSFVFLLPYFWYSLHCLCVYICVCMYAYMYICSYMRI